MKIKIVIIGLIIMCSNILIAEELITVKRFATRGKSPVFEIKIFNDSTAILNGYSNIEYIGEHKTRITNYYDTLITLLNKLDLDTLKEKYNLKIMDYPTTKITFNYKGIKKTVTFKREVPEEVKKINHFIINEIIKKANWEKIN
ncbi:MAG TPA: DUF6438 domain-containing protein [Ignavibacteriales bacterium]|nr:DUF6438 domain-containing protein [Ignavibacteriales bacterium]HOL81383.1 DUF6438 domain-containing protein [Ignavibacteriales bacterium]HOM65498.1 DUF6438 domain-containing protein [Ignavibacteriales bacterium]HPD67743.1 DUF6438 domain-containing protein [Ignavibacteriales bacterium]HPP33848.1 DUF6438 domain-containing protein [Ignavibacteriales bacterium]